MAFSAIRSRGRSSLVPILQSAILIGCWLHFKWNSKIVTVYGMDGIAAVQWIERSRAKVCVHPGQPYCTSCHVYLNKKFEEYSKEIN